MFKIFVLISLFCTFLFAQLDLQTASKEQLMNIKGIGEKKASLIIQYRKISKIKKVEDLKYIKGFGNKLIEKIKKDKYYLNKK